MEDECLKRLNQELAEWSTAKVLVVPGVMYQLICRGNVDNDNNRYQFNLFTDCEETYVHNHANPFDTLCLEGEYEEKQWQIGDDDQGGTIFKFPRHPGNIFDPPTEVPGRLQYVRTRPHFPGNEMHLDTHQYHSISRVANSATRVLTFVKKQKHTPASQVYVLSQSSTIDAPTQEPRPATVEELQEIEQKLREIRRSRFEQSN